MIKQPILGSKLLALRIDRGMTQHELREKCHVSVRTIQRIESGAVTPRASTVKILLEALDEDVNNWFGSNDVIVENQFSIKTIQNMLLINASEHEQKNALTPAWIAGIIYLLAVMAEIGLEAFDDPRETFLLATSMVLVKAIAAGAFFLFIRGFLSLGQLFENQLLRIASYLSIASVVMMYALEILIILFNPDHMEITDTIRAFSVLPLGAISIIFGVALLRLQDGMGRIAKVAGRLEIAFGISYLTLILSFVGVILLAPLLVVEIVLLSKADQQMKTGEI